MKKVKLILAITLMTSLSLTAMSCKNGKKENTATNTEHSEMNHDETNASTDNTVSDAQNSTDAQKVLTAYMALKDALVATNESAAAKAGKTLENTLKAFKVKNYSAEQQKELKDIIADATEHAEHISRSEIGHQREHFKVLSKDIIDMVAITGTENTLYQQFCPMYDGGGAWLSMDKNVKNPYYGNKMLTCGKVQKEIN